MKATKATFSGWSLSNLHRTSSQPAVSTLSPSSKPIKIIGTLGTCDFQNSITYAVESPYDSSNHSNGIQINIRISCLPLISMSCGFTHGIEVLNPKLYSGKAAMIGVGYDPPIITRFSTPHFSTKV